MPHPSLVSREKIIETARLLLEANDYETLTMARLANALGIKAPSLYKHFLDKNSLMQAVNTLTMTELTHSLLDARVTVEGALAQGMAMAEAYWNYAAAHPITYLAMFSAPANTLPDITIAEKLALPLQTIFAEMISPTAALIALRGAWAMLHGFVSLHLTQRFQREGEVQVAYQESFRAYLRGWGMA